MPSANHGPVTHSELRRILKDYPTKKDLRAELKKALRNYATNGPGSVTPLAVAALVVPPSRRAPDMSGIRKEGLALRRKFVDDKVFVTLEKGGDMQDARLRLVVSQLQFAGWVPLGPARRIERVEPLGVTRV